MTERSDGSGGMGKPGRTAPTTWPRLKQLPEPQPERSVCSSKRHPLSAALHVSPQQLQVVVADLAAPGRHALPFAVQHRRLKAREVVLREFAKVEGHPAGVDHVLTVAGDAKLLADVAAKLGIVGQRRRRCQGQSERKRRQSGTSARHQTFLARRPATWIGGIHGLSAQCTPRRATCTSSRYGLPSTVCCRARTSASRSCPGDCTISPATPKPLAIDALSISGLPR